MEHRNYGFLWTLDMGAEIVAVVDDDNVPLENWGEQIFVGRMGDADHAMAVFRAHTEEVRRTIAPERLLVYDVAEGWEPLCEFLGVAMPETSFPRINSTQDFQQQVDKSASS